MMKNPQIGGLASAGLYVFAVSLIFWPIADLFMNVWPIQLGNVQWRYGFSGLLSSYLHTPMLGLTLFFATAFFSGHELAVRVQGVLMILIAVVLLGTMSLFALDLLQIRGSRPENALPAMMAGGAAAVGKYFLAAVSLGLFGAGALRLKGRAPKAKGPVANEMIARAGGQSPAG